MKRSFAFLAFVFLTLNFWGQNATVKGDTKPARESAAVHKVMIIPFETRLYLSEIDQHINAESKLTAKEIKYKFRDGLSEQVFKAFKANKFNVVDLMEDTAKYKKDLDGIYRHLTYEYQKIPNQENYQPPKKESDKKKIEKGN